MAAATHGDQAGQVTAPGIKRISATCPDTADALRAGAAVNAVAERQRKPITDITNIR